MGKKTIEFFSSIQGVAEAFPISVAKENLPSWVNDARKDFLVAQKTQERGFQHIARCPGIFHLFNIGYIISMWFDLEITGSRITIPDKQINELLNKECFGTQYGNGIAKHIPKRPWSSKDILKINTPWHVMAPKDVKFLMIPIPYTDFFDFESLGFSNILKVFFFHFFLVSRNSARLVRSALPARFARSALGFIEHFGPDKA